MTDETKNPDLFLAGLHADTCGRSLFMASRLNDFSGETDSGRIWVNSNIKTARAEFEKLAAELGYEITNKLPNKDASE